MNTSTPRSSRWQRRVLLPLLLVGFVFGTWLLVHRSHSAADHDHPHHHDSDAALTLNDGQRWASDQPLRTGMQRIRDAFEPAWIAHVDGRFTAADAQTLSAAVQENVNYLIANCQLSPKADATLHVFITRLLTGSAHVAANPAAHEGWEQMAQALQDYPVYFEHPGWVALDAPKA